MGKPVPSTTHGRKLQRLRSLSTLLDNAVRIPGTEYRVGLDPLIGLIPGGGDLVGGLLSTYIVLEAARMGVPRDRLRKMGTNILLELGVGTIPVLGDFFDVTWKANARNVALVEEHLAIEELTEPSNPWFVALLVVAIAATVVGTTVLSIWLIRQLFEMAAGSS